MTATLAPTFRPPTKQEMKEFEETLNNPPAPEDELATPETPAPQTITTAEDKTDWKKRYADQTRHMNELLEKERKVTAEKDRQLAEVKAEKERLEAAKTTYVTPEAMEAFEKEFGEVAPFLKEYNAKTKKEAVEEARKLMENREAEKEAALLDQAERSRKLSAAHPDWAQLKADEIFTDWYEKQSASVHKLGSSSDVDDVILVLDMFKQQVKPKPSGPDRKELTATVRTQSKTETTTNPLHFNLKDWEKRFDAAQKLGQKPKMEKLMAEIDAAGRNPNTILT